MIINVNVFQYFFFEKSHSTQKKHTYKGLKVLFFCFCRKYKKNEINIHLVRVKLDCRLMSLYFQKKFHSAIMHDHLMMNYNYEDVDHDNKSIDYQ